MALRIDTDGKNGIDYGEEVAGLARLTRPKKQNGYWMTLPAARQYIAAAKLRISKHKWSIVAPRWKHHKKTSLDYQIAAIQRQIDSTSDVPTKKALNNRLAQLRWKEGSPVNHYRPQNINSYIKWLHANFVKLNSLYFKEYKKFKTNMSPQAKLNLSRSSKSLLDQQNTLIWQLQKQQNLINPNPQLGTWISTLMQQNVTLNHRRVLLDKNTVKHWLVLNTDNAIVWQSLNYTPARIRFSEINFWGKRPVNISVWFSWTMHLRADWSRDTLYYDKFNRPTIKIDTDNWKYVFTIAGWLNSHAEQTIYVWGERYFVQYKKHPFKVKIWWVVAVGTWYEWKEWEIANGLTVLAWPKVNVSAWRVDIWIWLVPGFAFWKTSVLVWTVTIRKG